MHGNSNIKLLHQVGPARPFRTNARSHIHQIYRFSVRNYLYRNAQFICHPNCPVERMDWIQRVKT